MRRNSRLVVETFGCLHKKFPTQKRIALCTTALHEKFLRKFLDTRIAGMVLFISSPSVDPSHAIAPPEK
jgi:hypothetical protein